MTAHQITASERALLHTVPTFGAAAEIAIAVLRRLVDTGQPVVQICGPMSTGGLGNLDDNMARFRHAIDTAVRRGLNTFDQLPFQIAIIRLSGYKEDAAQPYCRGILEDFYRPIFESRLLSKTLFLPGWEGSIGATWERQLVATLEISIEEYPEHWLE